MAKVGRMVSVGKMEMLSSNIKQIPSLEAMESIAA